MNIKTETSYENISWRESIGCSLIGITGKEEGGFIKCRISLRLFLTHFLLKEFLPKYIIFRDCIFFFFFWHAFFPPGKSAGRTASWLMRWDWAKLFSPLPSCRKYITWASTAPSWSLLLCPPLLIGNESSTPGLRWILLCITAAWPAGRWFSSMRCTAKTHG